MFSLHHTPKNQSIHCDQQIRHMIDRLVSSTFTQEQKSNLKFERNNDLTFTVIVSTSYRDIDRYENLYRDNIFAHIAQPYY